MGGYHSDCKGAKAAYGFELKPYSLVYKNANVQGVLDKILHTRRGIRVFADNGFVSSCAS